MENVSKFPVFLKVSVSPHRKIEYPFMLKSDDNVTKYTIDAFLISVLSEILHFKIKILKPAVAQLGTSVDGNWTGLIDMLARAETDLSNNYLSYDVCSAKVVHYLYIPVTFITD